MGADGSSKQGCAWGGVGEQKLCLIIEEILAVIIEATLGVTMS